MGIYGLTLALVPISKLCGCEDCSCVMPRAEILSICRFCQTSVDVLIYRLLGTRPVRSPSSAAARFSTSTSLITAVLIRNSFRISFFNSVLKQIWKGYLVSGQRFQATSNRVVLPVAGLCSRLSWTPLSNSSTEQFVNYATYSWIFDLQIWNTWDKPYSNNVAKQVPRRRASHFEGALCKARGSECSSECP